MKNFFNLEILVIQQCNMRCTYCFEGIELENPATQKRFRDISNYINTLLNNSYFRENYDGICLNYWGGEPTLNNSLIEAFMDMYKDDERINHFMYTNGTLPKKIHKLYTKHIKGNFKFQISYDGNNSQRRNIKKINNDQEILNNIEELWSKDIQFSIKSTLTLDNIIDNIVQIWDHFEEIHMINKSVRYSPTLEYTEDYNLTEEQLIKIKNNMLIISKKELSFYKKYGYNLFSWFENKSLNRCSAGINIQCIDFSGDISLCHGTLYSPIKNDFSLYNITDPEAILKFRSFRESFKNEFIKKENNTNPECKDCISTTCYSCPIVNYSKNKEQDTQNKLNPYEKLYTSNVSLCQIYKICGKYIKAVQLKQKERI